MVDKVTFYNKMFFLINGAILGNIVGVTHYIIGVLDNIDKFSMEKMINNGYVYAIYTMGSIYITYKINDIYNLF